MEILFFKTENKKPEKIFAYEAPLTIVLHYLEIKNNFKNERLKQKENNSTVFIIKV